jgi:hypothetical protein
MARLFRLFPVLASTLFPLPAAQHFVIYNGVSQATILAHLGRFPTAEAASGAAGRIESSSAWFAADPADRVAATEAFAALELRRHLCRAAHLNESDPMVLPIVDARQNISGTIVQLGSPLENARARAAYSGLDGGKVAVEAGHSQDGFYLYSAEDRGGGVILIRGNSAIGTLYGTYAYLESLGFRWYSPDERDSIVPNVETIRVQSLDHGESPAMPYRQLYADIRGPEFYLWMVRNRLNGYAGGSATRGFLRQIGMLTAVGQHSFSTDLIAPNDPYPYHYPAFAGGKDLPEDPYPLSPEYRGDVDQDGKLSYFEAHPEWFGLDETGKRNKPDQPVYNYNYCTSNPALIRELQKNLLRALGSGKWQDADMVEIWGFDGGKWCTCSQCRGLGGPSDRLLNLVYHMQRAITQARRANRLNRDVQLSLLAYQETIQPPIKALPADFDFDNTLVTLFPIRRCYFHNLNDPDCTELNVYYDAALRAWTSPSSHYRGRIIIGEYYNLSGFREFPVLFMHSMAADIPYLAGQRVAGMNYMLCPGRAWGHRALTNWQFAKQLWNTRVNVRGLWNDYFQNYYGPAASAMRQYYESLEQTMSNATVWRYDLWQKLHVVNQYPDIPLFPIGNIPPISWYGKRSFPGSKDAGVDVFLGFPERSVTSDHLHFEEYHPMQNDAPDWLEIMASLEKTRRLLNQAMQVQVPAVVKSRIAEDEYLFRYGELGLHLYDHVIRLVLATDKDVQRRELASAKPYAEQLRAYAFGGPAPAGETSNGLIGVGLWPILDAYSRRLAGK